MLDWTQWWHWAVSWVTGWTAGIGLIGLGAFLWFGVKLAGHYLGLPAIAAGCALIWGAVQYDAATDNCKEAAVRAQLTASQARVTELERQIGEGKKLTEGANARAASAETETKEAKKRNAAYAIKLRALAMDRSCAFTAAERRSLQ